MGCAQINLTGNLDKRMGKILRPKHAAPYWCIGVGTEHFFLINDMHIALSLHLEHWKIIAPTHVNIALQPEDGERIVQQFAITTTLWDVLRGFEAKG